MVFQVSWHFNQKIDSGGKMGKIGKKGKISQGDPETFRNQGQWVRQVRKVFR